MSLFIKQVEHSFGWRGHGPSDPWKRDSKLLCNVGFKVQLSLVLINGAQQTCPPPETSLNAQQGADSTHYFYNILVLIVSKLNRLNIGVGKTIK